MSTQEFYMKKCLELAYKGIGNVSPNPMVGSVIVFNNEIIGKGYHQKYGSPHAEANAIASVKDKSLLTQSTLYVNLEPCAHSGKMPPCSDLIIKQKIPKVIIGCKDTSSKVSGKGIKRMQHANIEVVVGVLEKESRELNKRFFTFHEKKQPYVILKWAESKDGFIAPHDQKKPFWMTSSQSKKLSHKWRSQEDAILVGRVTAEKDNPSLTVREVKGKNPIRIVIDKNLKLPANMNLFNAEANTMIFNEIISDNKFPNNYIKIRFSRLIKNILKELHKQNVQSIIIEGGTITIQSFININAWDEARILRTKKRLVDGVKSPKITGRLKEKKEIGDDHLKILKNA